MPMAIIRYRYMNDELILFLDHDRQLCNCTITVLFRHSILSCSACGPGAKLKLEYLGPGILADYGILLGEFNHEK